MLSIIIPSHKDPYLQKTIDGILANARGKIEIIAILDGYQDDIKGATIIHNANRRGLRDCVNSGVALSHGEYILKCDAHVTFDEGFDVKLLADIEDSWVVVPRRYKLDTDKWVICEDDKEPIDYEKLVVNEPDRICGIHWTSRMKERKDVLIDENMVFQGSCWVMSRKHWDFLGGLQEEGYGTFTQEPVEIALKTWLGGGKVMVNKKTWYAHQHRKFGRTHTMSNSEIKAGNAYSRDFWLNNKWDKRVHDIDWLLKRFKTKRLTEIGIKHGTDKATNHPFTDIYDSYFEKYKNPNILEIGVYRGASLKTYDEYYRSACNIVGLDNGRDELTYKGNGKNIKVIIGDQTKKEDMLKCLEEIKEYDIIVDDGGHQMHEQQISLAFLFDHVKSGGIYILEDLHTSFRGFYNHKRVTTTLDILTQLQKGEYTSPSRYLSQEDFDKLKKQIRSIEIFWKNPGEKDPKNSITSVIIKN